MTYTITTELRPHVHSDGTQAISIRITYKRVSYRFPTGLKVKASQWDDKVKDHPNAKKYNAYLKNEVIKKESALLDLMNRYGVLTKEHFNQLQGKEPKKILAKDFILDLIKERTGTPGFSEGRLKHYKVIANKIEEFKPNTKVTDINEVWMKGYEQYYKSKGISNNTLNSHARIIIAILRVAFKRGIREKPLEDYKAPKYTTPIPEYLTEPEIKKVKKIVDTIESEQHKLAGYYYLFSCYCGLRISDYKTFKEDNIKDGCILIKSKKTGTITSIPIFKELKEIIDLINNTPFTAHENTYRDYLADIAKMAGIKFRMNPHSGRHTFGMLLMNKGFTLEEAAELLGDKEKAAKLYARISNNQIQDKFKKAFGN